MRKRRYKLESKVFLYPGMAGWHFITVPKKDSLEIKGNFGKHAKGWGSLPVTITIGKTSWDTSIFPDKQSGTYLLPLKAAIRKKEDVMADDTVQFTLKLR